MDPRLALAILLSRGIFQSFCVFEHPNGFGKTPDNERLLRTVFQNFSLNLIKIFLQIEKGFNFVFLTKLNGRKGILNCAFRSH